MASFLVFFATNPSEKGSTLKGKNFLPWGANSFLLEWTPVRMGGENLDRDLSPVTEMYPLKLYSLTFKGKHSSDNTLTENMKHFLLSILVKILSKSVEK